MFVMVVCRPPVAAATAAEEEALTIPDMDPDILIGLRRYSILKYYTVTGALGNRVYTKCDRIAPLLR